MKLKLNKNINPDFVRFKVERRYKRKQLNNKFKTLNEFHVDVYLHEHSNYEEVQWSFWKKDKQFCMKEMQSLMMQISNIDKELVFDCIDKLEKYERTYAEHHFKSQYVNTDDGMNNLSLVKRVA